MVVPSWKIRQKVYHMTTGLDDLTEDLNITYLESEEDIIEKAVDYFYEDSNILYYPSKSYCVAILYAKLLEMYFNENFMNCLDDKDLLYNNDRFFVPYSSSPKIYDELLSNIPKNFVQSDTEGVKKTIEYFCEEFNIKHAI